MVWWFPATGGARRGAFPLEPMEYVFTEGTAADYDVMYDTVHAVPATPIAAAQSEFAPATQHNTQRKLVRTSDGTIYVVYFKLLAGFYQIYVIKSEDDGATWIDDTRISTYAGMGGFSQYYPAIAVDSSDNLHVVWNGGAADFAAHQIRYAKYTMSWADPVRISTYGTMNAWSQTAPSIAVDSRNNPHVVWTGRIAGLSFQTWCASYDEGWQTPVRVSTYLGMDALAQQQSCIAIDGNNYLHVLWWGPATGYASNQVWYRKYTTSWGTIIRICTALNMSINHQGYPCIAVDSNDHLHAVWNGIATDFATQQIRYATAVPPHAAGDWVTPIRISDALNMGTKHQRYPSIAVDSDDYLYVVWHGMATGYTTQNVVWLAAYVVSWATPECIQPTGRNQYPSLRWSRWPR